MEIPSMPESPVPGHSIGLESSLVDLTESPPKVSKDSDESHLETPPQTDWNKLSISELQTLLKCFRLSTEGCKDELVERLELRTVNIEATECTLIGNSEDTPALSPPHFGISSTGVDNDQLMQQLSARPDFAIFDVETTIPRFKGGAVALLEFGVIVVDSRTLVEDPRLKFSTLVKPPNLKAITKRSIACNSITADVVSDAPVFAEVANRIHRALDGRIWVGHNIAAFDVKIINEQFEAIGQVAPKPAGMIDTLVLFRKHFGKRAGDLKMASLGRYFGQGIEQHRALADAQMTLNVLRNASAVLFLEQNAPEAMWATKGASIGHVSCEGSSREVSVPNSKKGTSVTSSKEGATHCKKKVTRMPIPTRVCAEPKIQSTAHGEYVHYDGIEAFLKHHVGRNKKACDTSPSAVSALAKKKRGVLTSWVKKQDHESAPIEKSSTPFTLCQQIADLNLQGEKKKDVSGKEPNSENLTENQRQRIEANRLRALQLRSQKQGSSIASSSSSGSSNSGSSSGSSSCSSSSNDGSNNGKSSTSSSTSTSTSSTSGSSKSSTPSGSGSISGSSDYSTGIASRSSNIPLPKSPNKVPVIETHAKEDCKQKDGQEQRKYSASNSDTGKSVGGLDDPSGDADGDGGLERSAHKCIRNEITQEHWTDD